MIVIRIIRDIIADVEDELPEQDVSFANEYLDYNEWGLALTTICDGLYRNTIPVDIQTYKKIQRAALLMEMDSKEWKFVEELTHDWLKPTKPLGPDTLILRLVSSGIAKPEQILGCSVEEITQIEAKNGLKLPQTYVDFLMAVGRKAGKFMRDIEYHFPTLLQLNEEAEGILDNWEDGKLPLPEKAFVFSMRYGEQFMFFIADEKKDDPPVHFYYEGHGEFEQIGSSIWKILESELEMHERLRREYPDSPLF